MFVHFVVYSDGIYRLGVDGPGVDTPPLTPSRVWTSPTSEVGSGEE